MLMVTVMLLMMVILMMVILLCKFLQVYLLKGFVDSLFAHKDQLDAATTWHFLCRNPFSWPLGVNDIEFVFLLLLGPLARW